VLIVASDETLEFVKLGLGHSCSECPPDLHLAERVVRDVGQALFTALLGTGEVAVCYRASAAVADQRGEDLRIVLRIDAPELAALPWEAMHDSGAGGYVCRHHQLVRHVPIAAVAPPLQVRTPLRVLG
jgi:hypothetical protein